MSQPFIMKITIDTTNKTITLEDPVGISELNDFLKKILGDEIDKYSLISKNDYTYYPNIIPYGTNPPTIPCHQQPYNPDFLKVYCG